MTPEEQDDYISSFRRDGFAVIPDVIPPGELEGFGAAVDAAVHERTQHDRRLLSEKTPYEQSFIQCQNLWEDNDTVRPLTFHPSVCELAARLLGVERIRLWHDQALYKEAGGRETEAHQDQAYWPIREADTITAWIPFQDVDETNGAVGYVPGSHRSGLRQFVDIFRGPTGTPILERPELAGARPVRPGVRAGGVAFHHGLTVHEALPNRSASTRRVHTMIFFRDGCTRSHPYPHPSVERAGIEVGAEIRSDVTPLAWPRDAGELPPCPSHRPLESAPRLEERGVLPGRGTRRDTEPPGASR